MILVMDIGNTNIKCGLFEGGELKHSWRFANREQTSDELGIRMAGCFNYLKLDMECVQGIMTSSVRPTVNYTIDHMCQTYFRQSPIFVEPGIKTGMNILYDNAKELGPDRIVNAVAAYELYGGPCITVDFGTATTYGAISKNGAFLGGAISPGLLISTNSLIEHTAMLKKFEMIKPKKVINKSTISCLQSGAIYGFVGQVDYIIRKMKEEMDGSPKVIATGGMARLIASETNCIDEIDSLLTLKGLYIIYNKNK